MKFNFQQLHELITRIIFTFWGAVLGFASPFIIYAYVLKHTTPPQWITPLAFLLLILMALFCYFLLSRLFFVRKTTYLTDKLTPKLQFKGLFIYLFIASILIVSSPWAVDLVKTSIPASILYLLFFGIIGFFYGVQLLILTIDNTALLKAGVIGFNSVSMLNLFGLILFYAIHPTALYPPSGDLSFVSLLHTLTLNFAIIGVYSLLLGIFTTMATYYINSKQ